MVMERTNVWEETGHVDPDADITGRIKKQLSTRLEVNLDPDVLEKAVRLVSMEPLLEGYSKSVFRRRLSNLRKLGIFVPKYSHLDAKRIGELYWEVKARIQSTIEERSPGVLTLAIEENARRVQEFHHY